jgi:hypothetical protein
LIKEYKTENNRKEYAMANKQTRRNQAQNRNGTLLRLIPIVAAILFVVVAAIYVISLQSTPSPSTTGARLQFDREQIDLGKQIFDRPARATFAVKNVGNGALKLDVPKNSTLLEGC